MASISSVFVDFIANTGKYTTGLDGMAKKTKVWSDKTKGEAKGVTSAFDNTTKSITNLAKGLVGLVAIQRVGAAFANAAAQVSLLADEAEKVGASAAQFDKLRLAAERNGSELGDVKVAYKELQKSINEATNGTKETVKAFSDLGLSYSYINSLNPDKRFLEVADALSKIEDANKRAEIGTRLLGKSFTELSPLIAKGSAGIQFAGRGSLTEDQIKSIDAVTKGFEELGRLFSQKVLAILSDASSIILQIIDGLEFVINNLKTIATLVGLAFATTKLLAFARYIDTIAIGVKKLAETLAKQKGIATFFDFGNVATDKLKKLIPDTLIAGLAGFAAGLAKVAGVLLLIVKYVTIAAASIATFVGAYEIFSRLVSIPIARLFGANQYAANAQNILAYFEQEALAFLGFKTRAMETEEFLRGSLDRISAAQERLKNNTENQFGTIEDILKQFADEAEKSFQKVIQANVDLANSLNEKFKSPFDAAVEQFKNLTLAVDTGKITIDVYKKAVAELVKGLDAVDLGRLQAQFGVGPYQTLKDVVSTADQKSAAETGVRSSFFGVGNVAAPNIQLGDSSNRITDLANRLGGSGAGAKTVFEKQVADINMAAMAVDKYGNAIMSAADKTYALDNATEQYGIASAEAFRKSNEEMFNIVMLTEDFASSLSGAIAAGQSFGEALKNVFQDLTKQIIAMILRSIILQSILAAIGVVSPARAGSVAPPGASAAFASMMNIKPMAAGGPVKGGTPYQVGELGPEMFVPEGNGYIVPNNMMGGGGTVVNQTINVQTGVAQTVRAEMLALLPQFRTQAVNAVLETKQRGGSFSKGMTFA